MGGSDTSGRGAMGAGAKGATGAPARERASLQVQNVVVLRGRLARPPVTRALASGCVEVGYEVSMPRTGAERPAEGVSVVWPGAPARSGTFVAGDEVVVVGRVRRRFFRVGGITQSRTEVVAEQVVPVRRRAAARRAVAAAADSLAGVCA